MPVPDWVRFRTVAYTVNKGLDIGATDENIYNGAAKVTGKYCIGIHPAPQSSAPVCDDQLTAFTNNYFDYVIIERVIEVIGHLEEFISQAIAKLKVGGHLIFCLPHNPDASNVFHVFDQQKIKDLIVKFGSWQAKEEYEKDSFFLQIFKKLPGKPGRLLPIKPKPTKPRACLIRYGAIGDAIMMTPVIRKLHEDGYHVTVNCTPYCLPPLLNNPNVDNFIIQEREAVPNRKLGDYWALWGPEYDKYINLSESIEGKLLLVEGRMEFYTPKAYRHAKCNKNYMDFTMELAGYPDAKAEQPELFFTHTERKNAERIREEGKDKFIILWPLNGSSHHKVYPLMRPVLEDWLLTRPDVRVITTGDVLSKQHEFDHPQVCRTAGQLPLREAMCLTKYVDCIVGPETGMMNAASCYDTPKIVFLSHSTEENLCKYWKNAHPLRPNVEVAPCYPCHQLHYSKESCPLATLSDDRTGKDVCTGPICAMGAISGEAVVAKLTQLYDAWKYGKMKDINAFIGQMDPRKSSESCAARVS